MSESNTLNAPLTRRRLRGAAGKPPGRRQLPVARLAVLGIVALLGAAAGRILLVDAPDGGQPFAEVAINSTRNSNPIVDAHSVGTAKIIAIGPEIEPEDIGVALGEANLASTDPAAPSGAYATFSSLEEQTEYGPLPRRSGTGETPFSAYSRPSVTAASAGGRPLIAIVVTGLGINLNGTLQAVDKLPDTVTLAFAPYGKNLERAVGAARAEGHEVFLEVPLEPFDYPDNDPGPDTLLTGQLPRDNIARLYRVLGRFGGYAGLINNMGARFTASAADFGPLIEELNARGLGYIDDGSSSRSLAQQLATANNVPFARASLLLDGKPTRAAILERLNALEEQARQQGSAIGLVAALPISIDTVAEWSRELESRGFLIVPASALMQK